MYGSRTLAVDPGRSIIGVAVFEGAALHYYAVKTLQMPGTPEVVRRTATRIINSLIATYNPKHLAIEQPLVVQQRAELLAHVIRAIKTTARRHDLAVSEYAPQAVRRFICLGRTPTKREVALRLAARYPQLGRYIADPGNWRERYYERMFGAVAVGVLSYTVKGYDRRAAARDSRGILEVTSI
jgi:Holliday junction resolvasome RuvABC endonuclease subunit